MPPTSENDQSDTADDSALVYLRTRLLLFQLEFKEAAASARRQAVLYAMGAAALTIAYAVSLAGTIAALARVFQISWDILAIGAGGVHAIAAFCFFLLIRRLKQQQPFRESLTQLEKDRQWLESKTEPPPN